MLIIIGLLFLILMFVAVGGMFNILMFIADIPSFIIIIIPLIFFLCTSKSGGIISGYIMSSFKKNYKYSKSELESIYSATKNTIKFTMATGGFGFIIGLTACLVNMQSPEQLLLNLSVSFISLLYAIAISFFIFFPTMAWAENKIKMGLYMPLDSRER